MTQREIEKNTRDWEAFQSRMYLLGYAKFSKALRRQIEPIIASLNATESVALIQGLYPQLISTLPIQEAMRPFLLQVSDRASKQIARSYLSVLPKEANIGVGFGSTEFKAGMLAYIEDIGGQHITEITETTRKLVGKAFTDGVENGDTLRQLQKRIERYTLGSNGSLLEGRINVRARALLIAKTETLMCSGMAKDLQVEEYPYIFEKQWTHKHVKDPRHEHINAVSTRKDKNGFWILYGAKMKYAGDPNGGAINNCNCRCSVVYVPKEDSEGNLIRKN